LYFYKKFIIMKKIVFACSILLLSSSLFAQDAIQKQDQPATAIKQTVPNPNGPKMKFDNVKLDYGTIKKGSEPKREFTFQNVGKEPLLISNAAGSCGCTVPTWPKEPILPGKKSTIKVSYDTQRVGAFTKTITLSTNAPGQESFVLTISGTVEADPTATAPVQDKAAEAPKH
jgi:hypothetical protein